MSIVEICTVAGTLCALLLAGAGAYKAGLRKGRRDGRAQADRELNDQTQRRRYEDLYVPLWGLFLTRHVTSCRAILAGSFRQRWRNALPLFRRGRIRDGMRALNDRMMSKETAEIEFGGQFPLGQIQTLVREHLGVADQELMSLVREVDRADYENEVAHTRREWNQLSEEEFKLFNHIADEYLSLNSRFVQTTGARQVG